MAQKWYLNTKTGEIDTYIEEGKQSNFPRGVWLAYRDYLITGFKSRDVAIEWAVYWGACANCRESVPVTDGKCNYCGSSVEILPVKVYEQDD